MEYGIWFAVLTLCPSTFTNAHSIMFSFITTVSKMYSFIVHRAKTKKKKKTIKIHVNSRKNTHDYYNQNKKITKKRKRKDKETHTHKREIL